MGVDFPPADDENYEFQPRPVDPLPPLGPISKEEFSDRFYTYCEDCCHRWHQEQMRRWLPGLYDKEAIRALPKRKTALEMEDGKRELFWGLLVKEQRSAAMVLAYLVLCNTPSVIFFFLWLFEWGHVSDLQNASVPPMISLSLTLGFVGWIFQTREANLR